MTDNPPPSETEGDVSSPCPLPHENDRLLGHDEAENTLKAAYECGKLPHSWLITGPRGIGKATLAYRFARYVLKHSKQSVEDTDVGTSAGLFGGGLPEQTPDHNPGAGESGLYVAPGDPVFKRTASFGHANLLTIECAWQDDKQTARKSSISIEDVRKVNALMHVTSGEGGWRVVIVDAADQLNANSANALLKILEEPPAQALFLLVSHSPGRLLPTIRSRCRHLALRPLAQSTVSDLLSGYAPHLDEAGRAMLANLADGSIGRAMELAGEGGLEAHDALMELLEGLPDLDTVKLHKLGDSLSRKDSEAAFKATRDLLLWTLSRVIRHAAVHDAARGTHDAHDRETDPCARIASLTTLDRWLEVWEKITHLMERTEGLDRKQIVLCVFHTLGQATAPQ